MQMSAPAPPPSPPPRSQASGRSGPRTRMGCLTCRRRKVRCDQSSASVETRKRCGNCLRLELECHFAPPNAPRKPPRRNNTGSASTGNGNMPHAGSTPARDDQYGEHLPQQPANEPDASTGLQPNMAPQQPSYMPQPDAVPPPDHMNLDRVFGDMLDLGGLPNVPEWPPVAFSTGIMPSIPNLYTSTLLPWKDFSDVGNEMATINGTLPDMNTTNNNIASGSSYNANSGNGGISGRRQVQDPVPSSPVPDTSTRSSPSSPSAAGIDLALFDVTEHQRQLLLHFTPRANPIPLISPTDSQWKSAYSSLIGMACGCSHLINAICAVSELNLAATKRGSVSQAFTYYQSAASKGEAVLTFSSARVDDRSLKQAFATLLLLMHAEIMAQPLARHHSWPTTRLRTAHRHLKCHGDRLRLWTGIGSHILSWIQIVHSKAIYAAGMDKETGRQSAESSVDTPSSPNGTSTDISSLTQPSPAADHSVHLTSDFQTLRVPPFPPASTTALDDQPAESPLEEPPSAAEIAYDALYEPAYKFFMRCQSFIPRIIALDGHHRPRGPLDDELEVLQLGQRLRRELRDLWAHRPQGLGVLADTGGLQEVLHPRVALKVIRSFRSFVANFHAIRILLHRVAFIHYPASGEVQHAIAEILRLARDQIADDDSQRAASGSSANGGVPGGQKEDAHDHKTGNEAPADSAAAHEQQRQPAEVDQRDGQQNGTDNNHWTAEEAPPPATGGPFPIMLWLWPLFMCGTECGADERRWVLERMYAMRSVNAERTALLLTEVTKQQDATDRRVDQRDIRRRIFADEFDVVY